MKEKISGLLSKIFYKGKHEYYDYSIILVTLILTTIGLVMVYSTTSYSDAASSSGNPLASVTKQARYVAIALVGMIIISKIDYHNILRLAPAVAVLILAGCVYVFFNGVSSNGAARWIQIGPFSVQPSEFAKGALIVLLSWYIPQRMIPQKRSNTWKEIIFALKVLGITCVFVLPVIGENLSTGIIIFLIGAIMAYVPNRRGYVFWIALVGGVTAIVVSWQTGFIEHVLKDYQLLRIKAWLDPESGANKSAYQVLQGLYAIGSGGLFGKGLGNSIQKLGFLPEAQNDMIFAIICEEFGMFGAFLVMFAYIFLIYRLYNLAHRAPDMAGSMIIIGVMVHIGLQVAMNIAVVTNAMPNTGVALPFISSGGSAIISMFCEIGLVLGVTGMITE